MYTYIIIDDEKLIRKGTIRKLEGMSDEVACVGEADEGGEGIALIEKVDPDFIILDMQMPGMDGVQLLPYLAEHYPQKMLIVISGFRDFDYIKHAISADAIDYLLKPFSREAIESCVKRAISRLEKSEKISRILASSYEEKEAAYYEYDRQLLTNLILGYHTGDATISSERLKFINDTHSMILLTLYFSRFPEEEAVREWIEEGGFGDLAIYLPGEQPSAVGFLILFLPSENPVSPRNLVRQVSESMLQSIHHKGQTLLTGISQIHRNLEELNEAFRECSNALDQKKVKESENGAIWYQNSLQPRTLGWPGEDEFLFRIETGMKEEVQKLCDELFDWMSEIPGCTLGDVKYYCYLLSNQCRQLLNEYLKMEKKQREQYAECCDSDFPAGRPEGVRSAVLSQYRGASEDREHLCGE